MAKKGKGKDKDKGKRTSKKSKDLRSSKASTKTSAKGAKKSKTKVAAPTSFTEALRVGPDFELADLDPRATPGFDGDKSAGEAALASGAGEIGELQERLYAESRGGGNRSLLLVVQGMDTSGKGGIMRHVVGQMDPQGVKYTAFKAPSAEEKRHPFLWRIRNALPGAGQIGVFDRSQYEDVLIARVRDLVPRATWSRRYGQINNFEAKAVEDGTTIIKVMLHISPEEQKARLGERLDRPDKYWKFNPGDIDERELWPEYQEAYQAVLDKTSTDDAPWFVVPADRKWYARLAVQNLVLEHLERMDPQWPPADFDVAEQQQRLAET
jgi:PPK2 family polyphosphate:nucleotide phosphotransferase